MRLSSQSNPEFAPEAFLPPVADRHEIQSAAELPLLPLGHLALGLPKPLNYIDHPAYEGGYDEADPDEVPAGPPDFTKLKGHLLTPPDVVLNISDPNFGKMAVRVAELKEYKLAPPEFVLNIKDTDLGSQIVHKPNYFRVL